MKESIDNMFKLLVKGDIFLVFLIIMVVLIIGIIVYLVKLQINDREDMFDEDTDFKLNTESMKRVKIEKNEVPKDTRVREIKEERKEIDTTPKVSELPKKSILDEMPKKGDIEVKSPFNTYFEEEAEEDNIDDKIDEVLQDNIFEKPTEKREVKPKQLEKVRVDQSKFDFENGEVVSSIKEEVKNEDINRAQELVRESFDLEKSVNALNEMKTVKEERSALDEIREHENEQELNAIISASELDNKMKDMEASGLTNEHREQIRKYEEEEENKAIISYQELLERATEGIVSYESEENIEGIHVGKVDTNKIQNKIEVEEDKNKPYYKEEAFLEALKEFRRAL